MGGCRPARVLQRLLPPLLALLPPRASALHAILDELLAGYDRSARPSDSVNASCWADEGPKDPVWIDFGIEELIDVDQKGKTFDIDGYMRAYWKDERLRFPESSCRDSVVLDSTVIKGKSLWNPGYYVQNAAEISVGGKDEGEAVFLDREGNIFWSRRLRLRLSCPDFQLGQLPWDTQYCQVTVGVYRYKSTQVHLSWRKTDVFHGIDIIKGGLDHGEWNIDVFDIHEAEKVYTSGTYRYARACFKLKRDSNFFSVTMFFAVLLVLGTYAGLFINREEAGGRIDLSSLGFLMVITNFNAVQGRLPPLSNKDRIWLLDFLLGTCVFNFLFLLEYVVVNYMSTWSRQLEESRLFREQVQRCFDEFDRELKGELTIEDTRDLLQIRFDMPEDQIEDVIFEATCKGRSLVNFDSLHRALKRQKDNQNLTYCNSAVASTRSEERASVRRSQTLTRLQEAGDSSDELRSSKKGQLNQAVADQINQAACQARDQLLKLEERLQQRALQHASKAKHHIGWAIFRRANAITDTGCRWFFPVAYGVFIGAMFASWPFYSHLEGCKYA